MKISGSQIFENKLVLGLGQNGIAIFDLISKSNPIYIPNLDLDLSEKTNINVIMLDKKNGALLLASRSSTNLTVSTIIIDPKNVENVIIKN